MRKPFVPNLAAAAAWACVALAACDRLDAGSRPDADTAPGVVPQDARGTGGADASPTPPPDAATGSDGGVGTDTNAPTADAAGAWPAVADFSARGPHAVTRQSNTGPGNGYDLFRPAALGQPGPPHPIISWANGTLFGLMDYQPLLEHWASHGFVVIAGRTNSTAGGGTHKAGIDWLVAENARAGSVFMGQLDTTRIGAAGHSQGGGATIAAGSNKPGPTTTIPLMPILSFESDRTVTNRQLVPMLNINASMDDRDPSGAVAKAIYDGNPGTTAPLVQASYGGIHEDAMSPAMRKPTLAWFRWQLMGDTAARALFYPADSCGLCTDTAWRGVRHRP
jgi:hypothetical protein